MYSVLSLQYNIIRTSMEFVHYSIPLKCNKTGLLEKIYKQSYTVYMYKCGRQALELLTKSYVFKYFV
jgi:hypothetical protein